MTEPNRDPRWWTLTVDSELSSSVVETAHEVDDITVDRQQLILQSAALYGDIGQWSYRAGIVRHVPTARRISHNVISNATDSLVAEVTQAQVRPMFVTIDGTYSEHRNAKKLTAYMATKFAECKVDELGPIALRDGILGGCGALRPFIRQGEVRVERIHPLNILIDDHGAVDIEPRAMFVRRAIDKYHLAALYPEHSEAIMSSDPPKHTYWYTDVETTHASDLVEVMEAWHLPSVPEDELEPGEIFDGRRVIAIRDAVLEDEPWYRESFPMAFCKPVPPQRGFWGESLARRASTAQFELNKVLRRIQQSTHLYSKIWTFVQRGAALNKHHMSNEHGEIYEHDGPPPVFASPPAANPDLYKQKDWLVQAVYDNMGASRMTAEGTMPKGLESGKAIRLWRELGSRRNVAIGRAYERMMVDLAYEITHLERQIADDYPEHEVIYEVYGVSQRIPWREIDLDESKHRIRVFPASALPTTPAARLNALQEMLADGMIERQEFYELADMPDFESSRNLAVAPREVLEQSFDSMLDGADYQPPEPFHNVALGTKLAAAMIQKARLMNCPEERLAHLRRWVTDAERMVKRAQAKAEQEALAEMGPPPGMAPPGAPPIPLPGAPPMAPPGMPPVVGPPGPPGAPPGFPPIPGGAPPGGLPI